MIMIFGGLVVEDVWAERTAVIGLGSSTGIIAAASMSSRRIFFWLSPYVVCTSISRCLLYISAITAAVIPQSCHNVTVLR